MWASFSPKQATDTKPSQVQTSTYSINIKRDAYQPRYVIGTYQKKLILVSIRRTRGKIMELDVARNGIHSLAEALRAFKKFHDDPQEIFALKDAIIRSHHAFETLYKHVLYTENPALLLENEVKIKDFVTEYQKWANGETATVVDELRTISLEETIKRLENLKIIHDVDPKDYALLLESTRKLTFYRNKLQHFSFSAEPDVIGRILGNILPRGIDILSKITVKSSLFTEHPFFGSSLMTELKTMYNEAPEVIELLRHDYDRLVQEAIKFFEKRKFDNQVLNLRIQDHGRVGCPPYIPELFTEGFIKCICDHRLIHGLSRPSFFGENESRITYDAQLTISEPIFKARDGDYATVEGRLEFSSNISTVEPETLLVLPEGSEKLAILKKLTASVNILLDFQAEAFSTSAHFGIKKIVTAKGNLIVNLKAIPKGYKSQEAEIVGKYQIPLDEKSAPFRFDSFVAPDGKLNRNAPSSIDWVINALGSLEFR
jgi:hypothetical protein